MTVKICLPKNHESYGVTLKRYESCNFRRNWSWLVWRYEDHLSFIRWTLRNTELFPFDETLRPSPCNPAVMNTETKARSPVLLCSAKESRCFTFCEYSSICCIRRIIDIVAKREQVINTKMKVYGRSFNI